MPDFTLALKKAISPPPKPPAAPAPGMRDISIPKSLFITSDKCLSPSSKSTTSSGVAPFCGANLNAAPSGP